MMVFLCTASVQACAFVYVHMYVSCVYSPPHFEKVLLNHTLERLPIYMCVVILSYSEPLHLCLLPGFQFESV